jgi:hypothetical protein
MTTTLHTQIDLEEAIQRLIGMGFRDPLEYPDLLKKEYGEDWLKAQGALYVDTFAEWYARVRINAMTNGAIRSHTKTNRSPKATRKLLEKWKYVPSKGRVALRDLTAEDLQEVIDLHLEIVRDNFGRALFFHSWLELLTTHEAETMGVLSAKGIEIPGLEEIAEEADGAIADLRALHRLELTS